MENGGRPTSALGRMEDLEIQERAQDGDADSGVDESTQAKDSQNTKKTISRIPKKTPPGSPQKRSRQLNPLDSRRMPRSKSVPKPPFTTFSTPPSSSESKKVPMNKVVVGHTPSPNLKKVQSKVGSLANTSHRPGGGQIKIENRKLDWSTTSRTKNMNEGYIPGGGDRKIEQKKLSWNAQPKVGSLNNASHKPGGGTKKIEQKKVEWNSQSKVGSTDNLKHKPGGGRVQIHNEKVKVAAASRVGSLKNITHRPGGGDKLIFDDKEYIRQISDSQSMTRSGPTSLNGSVIGSSSQLCDEMDVKLRLDLKHGVEEHSDQNYSSQISRKLSPMSAGY